MIEGAIGQHWAAAAIGETLVSLEFTVSQATLSRPTDGGPASVYPHAFCGNEVWILGALSSFKKAIWSNKIQIVAGDAVCLQVEDCQCPVSGCLDFSWTSSMLHILLETAQLPGQAATPW